MPLSDKEEILRNEICSDIADILSKITQWKSKYKDLIKKESDLEAVITILKGEVQSLKDTNSTLKFQLHRCNQSLNQHMSHVNELILYKEKCKSLENGKSLLEKEIRELYDVLKSKNEEFDNRLEQAANTNEGTLDGIKKIMNENVFQMNAKFNCEKNELEKTIGKLQQDLQDITKESNKKLSTTVSEYEDKLMKTNEQLETAQAEIKNLKQKCAANRSLYPLQLQYEDKLKKANEQLEVAQAEIKNLKQRCAINRSLYPQQVPKVVIEQLNLSNLSPGHPPPARFTYQQSPQTEPAETTSQTSSTSVFKQEPNNGIVQTPIEKEFSTFISNSVPSKGTSEASQPAKKVSFPTVKKKKLFSKSNETF